MSSEAKSRFVEHVRLCNSWHEVREAFDSIPQESVRVEEGELYKTGWIFRGQDSENHCLESAIGKLGSNPGGGEETRRETIWAKGPIRPFGLRIPLTAGAAGGAATGTDGS